MSGTFQPAIIASRNCYGLDGDYAGLILGLRSANERRRYFVTTSLIGWVEAYGLRPANERRRYFVTTSLIGWAQA